jgi:hypothetical protein
MSRLATYRVSYRIVHTYHIDIEASSPEHAADWTQTLLNRFGTPIHGSKRLGCEGSVSDIRISGSLWPSSVPVA